MKVILIILFLMCRFAGLPQNHPSDKVPAPVRTSFEQKFPGATEIRYGRENRDYEIRFREGVNVKSALFDSTGRWLGTETAMREPYLPKDVKETVAKKFDGFRMYDMMMVETPDRGLLFEMDLWKEKNGFRVQFSPVGDILKKETLKERKSEEVEDDD